MRQRSAVDINMICSQVEEVKRKAEEDDFVAAKQKMLNAEKARIQYVFVCVCAFLLCVEVVVARLPYSAGRSWLRRLRRWLHGRTRLLS